MITIITKEQAEVLKHRQIIYYIDGNNKWENWYVNGKCKVWKKDKTRFQVPIKFGLYQYSYLNEHNAGYFYLTRD